MRRRLRWLSSLIGPRAIDRARREQDLKDELAFHFSTEVERRVAAGQSPEDALASAKRDFGNVPLVEEVTRGMWGWSMQDYKLGLRMLVKYPGLTIAGGLALAIAIGIGAGWYDLSQQIMRPVLPLPDGGRLVEIELENVLLSEREPRMLYDFGNWRRDLRSVEHLSAYRTIERNLAVANGPAAPVILAETTASAFRVARVPPILGRTLIDADERPGAPAVVVLGYRAWQRWFGGRADAIGQEVQLGRVRAVVVGVMPEGFAFPVNHQGWVPLPQRPSGYAPLEGGAIQVFGRLAPGATQSHVSAELATQEQLAAAASPQTHEHLRTDVDAYGGETGDTSFITFAVTHLPILIVLVIACTTVGTLVYARTATREAEIAVRSALGASRRRIVAQLFVEALVLASVAAAVGLSAAHFALKWGLPAFYSGQSAGPPFWIRPGLQLSTVLYAAGLAVAAAAMLGILPALKVTSTQLHGHLRNLGSGGSTLRFGGVWTTAMIVQVALTAVGIPPAIGIAGEAVRDRLIRARFPAAEYLAVPIELDRASGPADESDAAFAQRLERTYGELERRVAGEPGVVAVTFGDRLPGMAPSVRVAEVEVTPGAQPLRVQNMWIAAVGPGYFEAFEKPIVAGRGFHGGDRTPTARTVIVNEAFVRHPFIMSGRNPIGLRVRFPGDDPAIPQPWFDIVGIVRDIGMTPTDFGEAPHVYHAASPGSVQSAVMGVRVAGDPAPLVPRVRAIAAALEPGLRLEDVRGLDDVTWRQDFGLVVAAGALAGVVVLGLFLSSAGIFSLMSVSVARRTREIGLRTALGASRASVLRSLVSRAVILVGGGVVAGNVLLLLLMFGEETIAWAFFRRAVLITSLLMMTAGILACIEPARRALRINPIDALKQA
jgi:putative ABC transport system permease protein